MGKITKSLSLIAKEMIEQSKTQDVVQEVLSHGLALTLIRNQEYTPPHITLSLTRSTPGGLWPDDKAKEEKDCRQVFDVPSRASRKEIDRDGFTIIRYGWHLEAKTMTMFAPALAPWEAQ